MTGVWKQLHEIAANPRSQLEHYLAAGKKVIGMAPVYTPQEIVYGMGLVPLGVWGGDIELKEAKKYHPAFICSIVQSILELGIRGTYRGMSALIVPSLCDSLKVLGQNWKYAVKDIPFIPMTYPQNRTPAYGVKFTRESYERVILDLEAATGQQFTPEGLKNAIKVYNEHNAVMREFAEVAGRKKISAAERSDVFKSAWFMLPEEHTALVREAIEELNSRPEPTDKIRVLTSGVLADAPELLELMDKNGIGIVWDDIAAESRQYYQDTPDNEDPLEAIALKFASMGNCSLLYDKEKKRVPFLLEQARRHKAQAVLIIMTKFCDPEEFDYVPIRKACEAEGLRCINLEVDRQMVKYEQASTILQTLAETIRREETYENTGRN